jgi:antitoxin component of MazEF toxin-antitoxin module
MTAMIKTIAKLGNSQGIIFDTALMELAHLKVGDQVNLEIHEGRTISITPLNPPIETRKASATARRMIRHNAELFRRLS